MREMRAARVRRVIHERSRRAEYFRTEILSDPAWDLLLELYNAELSQASLRVSQLGILSNVPPTTAVRWVKLLECENLVIRMVDPEDSRLVFVKLTPKGEKAMNGYFRGGPGE
jgi:DNA-binding MarR family transcriptional regulator